MYLIIHATRLKETDLYVPEFNEEKDVSVLHALIKAHPLGAWATLSGDGIVVNHIPWVLHEDQGEFGTLVGHLARANAVWQDYSTDVDSIVVFQGDHAYITPSWYPSKHAHGRAVPTWNYAVVHAYGVPKVIDDPEWLLNHVSELTDIHEGRQRYPWNVADAPEEFIERLLGAIVGIEIPLKRLIGKWKLGQNRPVPDQLGVVAGLMSSDDSLSHGLGMRLQHHVQAHNKDE